MKRASASSIEPSFAACAGAFEAEFDYVFRTMRRLGARPAEAEDLAQDVFVVMWRRWNDFEPGRPLRPWLAGIARHVALDHLRKHSHREVASDSIEAPDEAPGPEQQLASARTRELVLRALARIGSHHREILIKYYLEGVSIREIATEWSLPFFTASSRLRRARLRFAGAVQQVQGGRPAISLEPEALLDVERPVPAAPELVRNRVRARLVQMGDAPTFQPPPAPSAPIVRWLPRGAGPAITATALLTVGALVARILLLPAPAGHRDHAAPVAPQRGLVAHWRFDDATGSTVARDDSGHERHCQLRALDPTVAWVDGAVRGALDLGRRGWLECPLPQARAGAPLDLTIAAWVKQTATRPGTGATLFTRQLPAGDATHLFWFGVLGDNLRVWSGAWTGWATRPVRGLHDWTHVAFAHSGRTTKLYVDGVMVRGRDGGIPRGEGVVTSTLTIGVSRFTPDPAQVRGHFDGLIDEALVYDRALGDDEIAALAHRTP